MNNVINIHTGKPTDKAQGPMRGPGTSDYLNRPTRPLVQALADRYDTRLKRAEAFKDNPMEVEALADLAMAFEDLQALAQ